MSDKTEFGYLRFEVVPFDKRREQKRAVNGCGENIGVYNGAVDRQTCMWLESQGRLNL